MTNRKEKWGKWTEMKYQCAKYSPVRAGSTKKTSKMDWWNNEKMVQSSCLWKMVQGGGRWVLPCVITSFIFFGSER